MLRRSWILLTELTVICVIGVTAVLFFAAYYVDTDEFREQFVQAVEQVTGQTAILRGELNIALYPRLSLEVLDLAVEGGPEFGDVPLIEFDTLRASVRLMPLFSRMIDIRTIVVEGMTINVVRTSDGEINWQSFIDRQSALLSHDTPGDDNIAGVSLSGLEVINAAISYSDKKDGDTFKLSGIDIRTGSIVPGEIVPFSASSQFSWKNEGINSQIVLKGMIEAGGESGRIRLKDASIYASVDGNFLPEGANPGEMTSSLDVDFDAGIVALEELRIRFLGLRAEGRVKSGDLSKGLNASGNVVLQSFVPATIIERYNPDAPVKSVNGLKTGSFKSDFRISESGLSLKNLALVLDDLKVRGNLDMKGYSHPSFAFTLRGGMVDLDRYLPLFETGTPFIWEDFGLELFDAFRGRGTIRADGFKVLDQVLTDVRLTVDANDKAIVADAGAKAERGEILDGRATFLVGKNAKTNDPTLGMQVDLNVKSPKGGFSFLAVEPVWIGGEGRLKAKLNVAQMDCPPKVRSIGILRHLKGDVTLALGAGQARYKYSSKDYSVNYSKAEGALKFAPITRGSNDYFGFNTDLSIRGQGGKTVRTFSIVAQGPLVTAVDKEHVLSSGLRVKSSASGTLYTGQSNRLAANGVVAFDSAKHTLSFKDATVRSLETTVKGDGQFSDLHTSFKGKGKLEIPGANVRRIVYLLSRIGLRTMDTEALKAVSLVTNYEVDEAGFRLKELEGKLDGMSFNGHIVGRGLKDPKLVFSLAAGPFDLDKYLPPSIKPTLEERRAGKVHKAPPVDLPLTFLRMLRLSGKVWFEEFKLAKIRARSLSGQIEAEKGKIHVSKAKGKVHGGDLTGNWIGQVGKESLKTHLQLHIEDMQAAPLMVDMAKREYVRGEADVDFDLMSSGVTDDDILKNLHGKAWARVRNGSFKFTWHDNAKPSDDRDRGTTLGGTAREKERRTVFQKAMAYFSVKSGVFTVDKFRVEAPPLLQSYGHGNFSLPDDTVNLSIRNDFVAVPSVTIQITGKLSDPEVKVPTGKIVDETVRNILSLPEKSFNFLRDLFK